MNYLLRYRGNDRQTAPDSWAHDGDYLIRSDPDWNGGAGAAWWTTDPAEAMIFADAGAALRYWRATSTVLPIRPDGKPNRPLTAVTIEVDRQETGETHD